jgi:hypothetical protein
MCIFPLQRTHATIEELSDASFSMRSVSYQRRVCGSVYTLLVARQRLGKHAPAATKNYWRRRFLCGPCRVKRKYVISSSQNFLFPFILLKSNCYVFLICPTRVTCLTLLLGIPKTYTQFCLHISVDRNRRYISVGTIFEKVFQGKILRINLMINYYVLFSYTLLSHYIGCFPISL